MSSIAASANPDRQNRWLLIGGIILAVITGVLVFAAVSNLGDDGEGTTTVGAGGDIEVLVARDTIAAGTKLEADMFRTASFAEGDVVPNPISNAQAIIGQQTTVDILRGQQLSRQQIAAATDDARANQAAFKVPDGHRGVGVAVDKVSTFGGLVVPGDRVDVVLVRDFKESNDANAQKFRETSVILQNVLVLAREQEEVRLVNPISPSTGEGEGEDGETPSITGDAFNQRPEDIDTGSSLGVVTLALTLEQVQQLVLAESLGDLTLVLRQFGDDGVVAIEPIVVPIYD